MITLIRSKDGTIKTFSPRPFEGYNLALGESIELVDTTFEEFAQRFVVSCMGVSGETLSVKQGSPDLIVNITAPGQSTVDVDINGSIETLTPIDGGFQVVLSTDVPGVFVIQPADRKKFCAAGQGLLVIEVNP
ncbi:MAG: hypothetical protein KBF64_07130 [Anaerolineaceae bacterium]|nr:hypothetical protein [Anaerolineaceae bacterium]